MAVLIYWSDEAKSAFDKNIAYLEEYWSEKEIRNFLSKTNNILSRIEIFP